MLPKIYPLETYHRPELIDSDALYVMQRLRDAGYKAYLVGGSVRDLLTKRSPKDMTSRHQPSRRGQAGLSRECILIGRRFRLAHVRFGHKVIEVSTFRKEWRKRG